MSTEIPIFCPQCQQATLAAHRSGKPSPEPEYFCQRCGYRNFNRPHRLHGAYVLAWVWVDLPRGHDTYTDDQIIHIAHDAFHRDGELEIDTSYTGPPTAWVSRNDEDWCDDLECGEDEA